MGMGHGAWGIGHWALGMGHWAWGMGHGERERSMVRQAHQPGERLNLSLYPLPFTLSPFPLPLYPFPFPLGAMRKSEMLSFGQGAGGRGQGD
ncbi:hypothetical protein VF03_26420 [Nostoc linckia z2]|nr:hypothetical protein VF03_26420 [Nostoc linckia z2]